MRLLRHHVLGLAVCITLGAACSRGASPPAVSSGGSRAGLVTAVPGPPVDDTSTLRRVAFGSCLFQHSPQPIWGPVTAYDPDVFLMIGDNVYADVEADGGFAEAYEKLATSKGFVDFRAKTPMLAVWDDHDYGRNDAGAEYPFKEEAKQSLLDFFGVPEDSPRRGRDGVYDSVVVGPEGQRVQIILLDTRYFRSQLHPVAPSRYRIHDDPETTMLGEAQWKWLAEQLSVPAQVRLLVSSIQVVSNEHPHERWGVFPHERARLLKLIGKTRAAGVVVLSGDRHRGELSRLERSAAGYPIYDLTSSSLNRPMPAQEANKTRVGAIVNSANFGTIDIVWEGQAHLVLRLHDDRGAVQLETTIALDDLQPRSTP